MANKVKFFYTDDLQKFLSLEVKDPVSLYFVDDANAGFTGLYRGESLIATGSLASIQANGLMSSADKQNLDELLERVDSVEGRLDAVERAAIGGVHYKGSVPTESDLPADAEQGDLYEVSEDSSEWCFNGEKWFEYGTAHFVPVAENGIEVNGNKIGIKIADESNGLVADESGLAIELATKKQAGAMSAEDKKDLDKLVALDIPTAYGKAYEVSNKPVGTLVDLTSKEMRIMIPANTEFSDQNGGGDANRYYIGFRAYAPSSDVVSFKESLSKEMTDDTMYYFEGNDFAGIDPNTNRKYSIVWLPVAAKQEDGSWNYYGKNSTIDHCIGWHYCVKWYNTDGVCVASDLIRINLTNEEIHNALMPTYMSNYATKEQVAALEESVIWESL